MLSVFNTWTFIQTNKVLYFLPTQTSVSDIYLRWYVAQSFRVFSVLYIMCMQLNDAEVNYGAVPACTMRPLSLVLWVITEGKKETREIVY